MSTLETISNFLDIASKTASAIDGVLKECDKDKSDGVNVDGDILLKVSRDYFDKNGNKTKTLSLVTYKDGSGTVKHCRFEKMF